MRVRLVPRSIVWQLVVLVTFAAVIFHACMGFTMFVARSAGSAPLAGSIVGPVIDLADSIDLVPAGQQATLIARFAQAHPYLQAKPGSNAVDAGAADDAVRRQLAGKLPPGSRLRKTSDDRLLLLTPKGVPIVLTLGTHPTGPPQFSDFAFATTLFVALSATLFLVWAIRNVTAPLATFAAAADRFALDERDAPLSEVGCAEVAMASRAFNRMQARIRSMLTDRTHMLSAIGHDLRTPITRLRLRAEYISDMTLKQAFVRDLESMDALVHSALSFLRDGTETKSKQAMDLASLLQSICDDYTDIGNPVCFEGPDHAILDAHPDDVKRMFTNIIGNAVAHGKHVAVVLNELEDSVIEVDVRDDGPGMTDLDKAQAFEPFWRGGLPRADGQGFGLGLSIVQAIAAAHQGTVSLLDAPAGGLLCRVRLPQRL